MVTRSISIIHPDGVTKTFTEGTDIFNVNISYAPAPKIPMMESPVVDYSPTQRNMGVKTNITVTGTLTSFTNQEAMKDALDDWNRDTNKYSQVKLDYGAGGPADKVHKGMITGGNVSDDNPGSEVADFTFTITKGAADA